MFKKFLKNNKKVSRGMTFIEMVVVLGIFGAIASTALFNYGDFSSNIRLRNLSQDVALLIKRAQNEAISGRLPVLSQVQIMNINELTPLGWTPSYGVTFATINDNHLSPIESNGKSFFYYFNGDYDSDGNTGEIFKDFFDFANSYNGCGNSPDSECLDEIKITSGDMVDLICTDFSEIDTQSDDCGDGDSQDYVSISFTRPMSNATIIAGSSTDSSSNVFIRISSSVGGHKYISVWQSGYISVQ